jgi:hypothetical protein
MNAKTTARAAGWCLLLIVLPTASPVSAEAPAASKPLQERYLQAIDQEIQRTRRLLRLEMETQETDDVQRLALLRASQEELRRLEARLERSTPGALSAELSTLSSQRPFAAPTTQN